MTGDDQPLALRPDQADWETDLWARQAVRLALTGEPPDIPLHMPPGAEEQVRQVVGEALADLLNPGTT